jgi:S1-C subfamily serine protease
VIIDSAAGMILTNHHVVEDSDSIQVRLQDGRRYPAQIVGSDPPTDLAVIRIEADNLASLQLGDSDALEVGDPVMTVGNPFGLQGTVSKGIVSAVNRYTPAGIISYEGFIQTDAVINPGNSGGPLVNMRGEIVGINTAIESSTGGFDGVGFAIPSARIKNVLPALVKGERVQRGFLGVHISDAGYTDDARALGWEEPHGIMINRVQDDSPAQRAGLQARDIILRLDGRLMQRTEQLTEAVAARAPGTDVVLDLWRNQREVSVKVTLAPQPQDFRVRQRFEPPDEVDLSELGLVARTLDDELARRLDLHQPLPAGVAVVEVHNDSRAAAAGIAVGDVITQVNGLAVEDSNDFRRALSIMAWGEAQELQLRLHTHAGVRDVRLPLNEE